MKYIQFLRLIGVLLVLTSCGWVSAPSSPTTQSDIETPSPTASILPTRSATGLTVSPQGPVLPDRYLAFELKYAKVDGENYGWRTDVYIARASGVETQELMSNEGRSERNPIWSPDGRSLALISDDQVYVVEMSTLSATPVGRLDFGVYGIEGWSPDGGKLYIYSNHGAPIDGSTELLCLDYYELDVPTGQAKQLPRDCHGFMLEPTPGPACSSHWDALADAGSDVFWSSDCKLVAYVSGGSSIYLRRLEAADPDSGETVTLWQPTWDDPRERFLDPDGSVVRWQPIP